MSHRYLRVVFAVLLVWLGGATAFPRQETLAAHAAATDRSASASVMCGVGGGSGDDVTIVNNLGAPLVVSFAHGVTLDQSSRLHMAMVDPGTVTPITVADGTTASIPAGLDNARKSVGAGSNGAALVVTNFGILLPRCGSSQPAAIDLGPAPTSEIDTQREQATIAAETLGTLESWRAYPALFALLHPDVQAATTFPAVACWFVGQDGTFEAPVDAGQSATVVTDVVFGSWTWAVNGTSYPNAAAVTVSEQTGGASSAVTSSEHLVEAGGQWRWFFGLSQDAVDAQPTDCDLGGANTTTTVNSPATVTQSAPAESGEASITITTYTCPAGITLETLDPDACSLDPGAAQWTLSGSSLASPLPWGMATEDHGPGYSWTGLAYGEYIIDPDVLPEGVENYAIAGSANASRQDTGVFVTLGADEPHVRLSIYLFSAGSDVAPPAVSGAVEVVFYDCQPGMTPDTFDPSLCSPMEQGFGNVTLTPGSDVDPSALPGGPIFTITSGANLGGGAFQIADLPPGTYLVGPGQNFSGPVFYSPDGEMVGDSTYAVTISADNPTPVLNLYRLSQGIG